MRNRRFTQWVAIAAALAVAGMVAADDRDFLQEVAAAPNLIFILDTSSSMVGSPEVPGFVIPGCDPTELWVDTSDPLDGIPDVADPSHCYNGARVNAAMVPGGGDDPYSRLGIAKKVLKEFLGDVGVANVALAGYAQANPDPPGNTPDLSGVNLGGVPTKHWVYEARAQDRFHMVEATYAYRLGSSWSHDFQYLDVPADLYKQALIGYIPYFDPDSGEVYDRFGPLNALETGYKDVLPDSSVIPVPYDLMPLYFDNCFVDNMETPADLTDDVTRCADGVFPFYDSGIRDTVSGDLIPATWYYGQFGESEEDYPGCDPNDPIWDDGSGSPVAGACENEWELTSGADIIQYQRRVRLEIPATVGGNPNHLLAVDLSDNPVGNTVVTDGTSEDYDLDGFSDTDLDGDSANDWMLYINSVEEQNTRTCAPAAALPTWTPTPTITPTFTNTHSPTFTPTPVCRITVDNMRSYGSGYGGAMGATIHNGNAGVATITRLYYDWGANMRKWAYHDWMRICTDGSTNQCGSSSEEIWDLSTGSYSVVPYTGRYVRPVDLSGPGPWPGGYTGSPDPLDIGAGVTTHWWAYLRDSGPYVIWDGYYQVCFDFTVAGDAPGGGDLSCPNICAESYEGSFGTPTPTQTSTPTQAPSSTATRTSTNTPIGGAPTNTPPAASTPTNTPTTGTLATSTPTPFPTNTPMPPTATRTATKTATPTT